MSDIESVGRARRALPMAVNLARAGTSVLGRNRTPGKAAVRVHGW